MVYRLLSTAVAGLIHRWRHDGGFSDVAPRRSPLRLSDRHMLNDHMMRDIGILEGRSRPARRKHLSEF